MVQRKEPTKLKSKSKTKQVSKSKPHSFDLDESTITISKETASTDNTKNRTMKYLPNYMKPTSSSDARKEKDQLQVTHHNSPSITNSSRKSNPKSSSSPPSVTSKRKALTPFLKRNKSKVLFQKLNLNRATCSSTLKDSKFPKFLDLNPGGTESAGNSAVRVCPYTYCSLNGHVHEPMPPLKSFLASKRKLIKTQQSMKLKGFSPFRKREPKRSEKEVSPLIQEVVNDFIVEVYASTKEKIIDPTKTDEVVSTASDLKSDFSVEEMDATVKLVEYVNCDQEVCAVSEKISDLVVKEAEEENPVVFYENCNKFESFKEFDVDFMEDEDVFSDSESFSSERTDGGSDRSHDQSFELKAESVVEEMHLSVASESEIQNQMGSGTGEEGIEEAKEDIKLNSPVDLEERGDCTESEVVPERKDDKLPEIEPFDSSNNEIPSQLLENIGDQKLGSIVDLDKVLPERREEKLSEIEASAFSENEIATQVLENSSQEKEDEEEDGKILEVETPNSIIEQKEEENHQEEGTEVPGTESDHASEEQTKPKEPQEEVIGTIIEENGQLQAVENLPCTEMDHESEEPESCQPKEEAIASEISQIDQLCGALSEMRIEGEDYSFDPTCEQKNRLIIARRRPMSGEDEYMRGFNPRAPRFLPAEPDLESEKVDLRHQMMDDRKNAEEYLLDYALRRAVNQLAPARKKKVELLVAAFEKVVPVPGGRVTCS
ncbi:Plant calmodulin-binding domain-containing protein [Carex littledalei]|uniref:Plant calmodulin-binding domain-containing protein n=1 Tax=Carex littledalei TaxID=544730 RepID=A0A833QWF0_9POAL|nr:Plant calmodulin-binding domain-containing protein [Carex littledalei]